MATFARPSLARTVLGTTKVPGEREIRGPDSRHHYDSGA